MSLNPSNDRVRKGFALVKATGVVIALVAFLSLAVPAWLKSVEAERAADAFRYLNEVHLAQLRYFERYGTYTDKFEDLDLPLASPSYFSVGPIEAGETGTLDQSWQLCLKRLGASTGFDGYTIVFTQQGFDRNRSSVNNFIPLDGQFCHREMVHDTTTQSAERGNAGTNKS